MDRLLKVGFGFEIPSLVQLSSGSSSIIKIYQPPIPALAIAANLVANNRI
jgi:hypothetical protein